MKSITIKPSDLPTKLLGERIKVQKIIDQAARSAANRLKAYLVQQSDDLGITDTGVYKNSFVVNDKTVTNEAPHAPIVEMGARPHHVGREGRERLKQWCMRKLHLDEQAAEQASWAIATKIAEVGIEGRHVMENALPKATEFFREEIERRMAK